MKQTAFWREKNGEYRACLKYSVPIFVEYIYKMQRLEVSGAVRPTYGSLGVKRLMNEQKTSKIMQEGHLQIWNSAVKKCYFRMTSAVQASWATPFWHFASCSTGRGAGSMLQGPLGIQSEQLDKIWWQTTNKTMQSYSKLSRIYDPFLSLQWDRLWYRTNLKALPSSVL